MRLLNKLKIYQKIFLFAIIVVASIAVFDILSMNSGMLGNSQDYTNGNYTNGWWSLFFQFNSILIILVSLAYYWFGKHDFSESFSLLIGSYILWFTGLADLLFFWFQKKSVPFFLYHLNNHIVIGKIANVISSGVVTNITLYISVVIGLILVYLSTKFLEEKF